MEPSYHRARLGFEVSGMHLEVAQDLTETYPRRVVDDDSLAVGEGFDRMADTARHDCDQPRSGDLDRSAATRA